jgi:hypothetical protein
MRPETLQTLSQILVLVGLLLAAFGGYGHFHFGKMVEQKNEIKMHEKIDNIPKTINSTVNKDTDSVLSAIKGVKESVDDFSATEGYNITSISYPLSGEFGVNILDRNNYKYTVGKYSMKALIPKNQKLSVKISGIKWGFPAFQSLPGWKYFDSESKDGKTSRMFKTVKFGSADLEFYLTGADDIEITVFENDSSEPTWKKTIKVE